MKGLYLNMFAVLEVIDDCLQKRRLMPGLVLLYSAVDAVASLERCPGEGTKVAFMRWVNAHMLKGFPLACTALELYAARCGIVHNYAAESDLSRKGRGRRIFYAWGTAKAEDLQKAADILHTTDCVSVHVEDMVSAFPKGLANYFDEINDDKARQERVSKRASLWLTDMQPPSIRALFDRYRAVSRDSSKNRGV
jgi:hypothetical protein